MTYNDRYKEFEQHLTSGKPRMEELVQPMSIATGRASRYIHGYSPSDNKH